MKRGFKVLAVACALAVAELISAAGGNVKAAENIDVKQEGQDYILYVDGVPNTDFTGLKKIVDDYDETFIYYFENGKAVKNKWVNAEDGGKTYTFYFGGDGEAYKAESIVGMRTTKVCIKKVAGKKYGFDENGHRAVGLWSTGKKLAFFNKNGVYNAKKSKKYQKVVKIGKTSKKMVKTLKKNFGKPKKVKKTGSCNPFDIKAGQNISGSTMKRYKGYTYKYQNIVISLTKNTKTGVYHMDGAGPIDLD